MKQGTRINADHTDQLIFTPTIREAKALWKSVQFGLNLCPIQNR